MWGACPACLERLLKSPQMDPYSQGDHRPRSRAASLPGLEVCQLLPIYANRRGRHVVSCLGNSARR